MKIKRLLALIVATAVTMSAAVNGVTTVKAVQQSGNEIVKRLELLSCIGAVSTDDYPEMSFENEISRYEYVEALGKLFDWAEYNDETFFTDVPAGSVCAGYVNAAYKMGYLKGTGSGIFDGNDTISVRNGAKVLVYAMGYKPYVDAKGETAVLELINRWSLTDGIVSELERPMTNSDLICMMHNVLLMPMMTEESIKVDKDGNITLIYSAGGYTSSLLYMVYDMYKVSGIVNGDSVTTIDSENTACRENEIMIEGKSYIYNGVEDLLGKCVDAYVKTDKVTEKKEILYIELKDTNVLKLEWDNAVYKNGMILYEKENGRDGEIEISDGTSVIFNGVFLGKFGTSYVKPSDFDIKSGYIELVDNDDDSKYEVIKIFKYETIFVERVDVENKILIDYYQNKAVKYDRPEEWKIYSDGTLVNFENIRDNNVLSVAESRNGKNKVIHISANKVNGTVEKISDEKIVIGSKEYKVSAYYDALVKAKKAEALNVGKFGTFFFDIAGEIAGYNNVELDNYGYVIGKDKDGVFETTARVRLFTNDGEFYDFNLAKRVTVWYGGTSTVKTASAALDEIEEFRVIKFKLNSKREIREVHIAKITPEYEKDVFTRNAYKQTYEYFQGAIGAQYGVDTETVIFNVPNPDTAGAKAYDEKYYNSSSTLANGIGYKVDVYDADSDYMAKVIVCYNDTGKGNLQTGYLAPFVVSEVYESLIEDEVCLVIKGISAGVEQEIYVEDKTMEEYKPTESSQGKAWIRDDGSTIGDIKFGDIIQFSTRQDGKLENFRWLFRNEIDTNTISEVWAKDSAVSPTTNNAGMYTAHSKVLASNGSHVRYEALNGVKKVTAYSNYTYCYLIDKKAEEVLVYSVDKVSVGDEIFLMSNSGGSMPFVAVYR